jgi:hypothetical protein
MNRQQALESGHQEFWGKTVSRSWGQSWIWGRDDVDMCEDVKPFAYEFLPIPTAKQLLGAVEKEVHGVGTGEVVYLDDMKVYDGDQVIIMRNPTPLEPGKVTQEGE